MEFLKVIPHLFSFSRLNSRDEGNSNKIFARRTARVCVVERHQQARLFKGQSVFVYSVETFSHNVLHHVGAVSPSRQLSITIKTINRPLTISKYL